MGHCTTDIWLFLNQTQLSPQRQQPLNCHNRFGHWPKGEHFVCTRHLVFLPLSPTVAPQVNQCVTCIDVGLNGLLSAFCKNMISPVSQIRNMAISM